jgi:hypothetical protein
MLFLMYQGGIRLHGTSERWLIFWNRRSVISILFFYITSGFDSWLLGRPNSITLRSFEFQGQAYRGFRRSVTYNNNNNNSVWVQKPLSSPLTVANLQQAKCFLFGQAALYRSFLTYYYMLFRIAFCITPTCFPINRINCFFKNH